MTGMSELSKQEFFFIIDIFNGLMDKVDIMQEQMNNVKVRGENSWKCPKKEMLEIKNTSVAEMKNVFFLVDSLVDRAWLRKESLSLKIMII